MRSLIVAGLLAGGCAVAADPAAIARGRKEEARSCVACHSLRLIHSQRLSRAVWTKEVAKMAGWGTVIADREALIEYLAANYGDDKAPPPPAISKDGTAR